MQCLSDTCGKWLSPLNARGCSMPNHRLCESIQGTLKLRNKEGNGSMDYDGKQGANDGSSPKVVTGSPRPRITQTRHDCKTRRVRRFGSSLMCAAHKRIERDTNSPRFCLHGQKKLFRPSPLRLLPSSALAFVAVAAPFRRNPPLEVGTIGYFLLLLLNEWTDGRGVV